MVPRNWWNVQNFEENSRWENLTLFLKDCYNILSKGLTFQDNVRGALLEVSFTAANSNTTIRHGLSYVPSNYILVGSSVAMSLYDGTISPNNVNIVLKSSAIGTARVFIF